MGGGVKFQAKNSKGTKECAVESQSFSSTQAVFTDFAGFLGKYQQYVCAYVCHLFFLHSAQVKE